MSNFGVIFVLCFIGVCLNGIQVQVTRIANALEKPTTGRESDGN